MFVWTTISFAVAAPLLLLLLHSFLSRKNKTNSRRLPPGPPGWPLIGNLLDVGCDYNSLHKRLVEIQKKYGSIFMISVGWQNMMVIASDVAAMELFKTHDQAFSIVIQSRRSNYQDVMDLKSASDSKLYQLPEEIVVVSSKPNVADVYPWLRNLDPQYLASRMKKAHDALLNIVDEFAKERKSRDTLLRNNKEKKDYWDLLMDFEGNGKDEPKKLSDRYINFFIAVRLVCESGADHTTVA
ncbi:hypothetical protein MKX01_034007 [Papaver californicum]|nr:hypothetical protein MKX01_034007 [Papaver californicum]